MIDRCLLMCHGQYEPPAPYENLGAMLDTMNKFQHRPFYRRLSREIQTLFERYEVECLSLMALSQPTKQRIAQQALTMAGFLPPAGPQPAPPGGAAIPNPAVME
jgi:hypothetical protein